MTNSRGDGLQAQASSVKKVSFSCRSQTIAVQWLSGFHSLVHYKNILLYSEGSHCCTRHALHITDSTDMLLVYNGMVCGIGSVRISSNSVRLHPDNAEILQKDLSINKHLDVLS